MCIWTDKTYPAAEEIVIQGSPGLQPQPFLRVLISEKQSKVIG